eukprot:2485-Heterococcus_DN1.PRE.1
MCSVSTREGAAFGALCKRQSGRANKLLQREAVKLRISRVEREHTNGAIANQPQQNVELKQDG